MVKITYILLFLIFFIGVNYVDAHGVEEETLLEKIFENLHWGIFALLLGTCYYFRSLSEKNIFRNPKNCTSTLRKNYKGDKIIYQFHRYFFWFSLIFVIWFIVSSIINYPAFLSRPVGLLQLTTRLMELFISIIFLFYLLGCHHFRYVLERGARKEVGCQNCWRKKLYHKQTWLNQTHDYFFWFSIIGVIALHIFFIFGGIYD